MKNHILRLFLCFGVSTNVLAATPCGSTSSTQMNLAIDTAHTLRQNVPTDMFGFNVPWYAFQIGLQSSGKPKSELIELLKPFAGALYRYPGGTPSNHFDWVNSTKPIAARIPNIFDFGEAYTPVFGYDEFLKFIKQVNGHAVITLNLIGPNTKLSSPITIGEDAVQFVDWLRYESSAHCVGTEGCPIEYLELGNELDWAPYMLSSKSYSDRANSVINAVGGRVPSKVWIANGKTAPWVINNGEKYNDFNEGLANNLPKTVLNIAFHPYYDGISIPTVMKYLDAYYTTWSKGRESASVIVTEHARWPSTPPSGQWQDRWYEATGQGGAISSADFILTLLPNKSTNGAIWHALGVRGPWQLIRWDKSDNTLYPSPVYWGLRTLREGFLKDIVEARPNMLKIGDYAGGYGIHLVAMKADDKISLLGINRSNQPVEINANWLSGQPKNTNAVLRYTSASNQDDNDDTHKDRVVMHIQILQRVTHESKSNLCIPANSVFSIIF